jgi:hypothetical protein
VFKTMNPADTFGDRVEFSAVDLGTTTRIYLGDSSDDLLVARVWRTDDAASIAGSPTVGYSNAGWTELSSSTNGTNGFLAYGYCQNGQCGYDDFVVSPAGQPGVGAGHANELWLGGSMNYDELVAYGGLPPRSNGRAVIRTTNGGALPQDVSWQDMTGTIGSAPSFRITGGIHPDEHAVVFNPTNTGIAFVGSDGGVVRVDVSTPQNASEMRSFYVPFIADPVTAGRAYIGLEHVWRTDDNGGDRSERALRRDARSRRLGADAAALAAF